MCRQHRNRCDLKTKYSAPCSKGFSPFSLPLIITKNKVFVQYRWEGSKEQLGDNYSFYAIEILTLNKKRDIVIFISTKKKLINIIKVKNGSKEDKLKASKWLRTKKIIGWLLARLPASSEVMVIAYNDDIHFLGGRNWIGRGSSEDIQSILKDLAVLIPEGGTNLQKGLRTARNFKPTNLYLITDGLPTIGESRFSGLNPFATCNSLLGKSSKISGECRIKLFQHSIYENMPPGVIGTPRINVILLPIEGDPDAVNEYWAWSSATGGLLISPASDWP